MQIRGFARNAHFAVIAAVIAAAVAGQGCGDGETSTTASTSSAAASSGTGAMTVNGCTEADADDMTAMTAVTITFANFKYTPPCVKVAKGTSVTFSGDFSLHPLVGGEFVGGVQAPDPASPITETATGMMASFTLSEAGAYPYYCKFHTGVSMFGVVYVE